MKRTGMVSRRFQNPDEASRPFASGEEPGSPRQRISHLAVRVFVATFGIGLIVCGILPTAQALHLKHASDARLEEVLKLRLEGFPKRLRQIAIAPSLEPRDLPQVTESLPDALASKFGLSSGLSLLYWDGKAIKHNVAREDIRDDLPVYGMSMSKSIASYLLGRAFCDGLIDSLDDPIKKYATALEGTFYGNVTISDALNMTAGDRKLYSSTSPAGGGSDRKEYMNPLFRKGVPIVDAMRALGNREPSEKIFAYRNANTDAVAMVISAVSPDGLGEFASRTLARDAGFERPAMYLADRNNAAFAFVWFYATRLDWLRAAILIAEQYKAKGCIGDYLRSAVSESVPVNIARYPHRRYGKFFYSGPKYSNRKLMVMAGHGGQRIYIDVEEGKVLYLLSIRRDFTPWEFTSLFD